MFASTVTVAMLAALAAAAPSLSSRQGGSFVAVGNKYRAGGCVASDLIFADPIFGDGNVCQPLDRFGDGEPIKSYTTTSVSAGCSVFLYTGAGCSGIEYFAPVNECRSTNAGDSFVSTKVVCR